MVISPCVVLVPHADDLVPDGSRENALAASHQEPHRHDLGVPPGHAIEPVHVSPQGGPLLDHLVPILVQRPEQDRGYVHCNAAVSGQQCVHQRVLLLGGLQVAPAKWQLVPVEIPLHLVAMDELEIEVAFVPLHALHAQLQVCRQIAALGARAEVLAVPVGPHCLLSHMSVHLWISVARRARHGLVRPEFPIFCRGLESPRHLPLLQQALVLLGDPLELTL
mmetsp:Transcript_43184/g.112397  ORF Transcript_43184/g.112397 Transcript_43184/m.112397 type:complete len:221 (-) Transcript_43184:337-999(-)